jgi:hypothetical protein
MDTQLEVEWLREVVMVEYRKRRYLEVRFQELVRLAQAYRAAELAIVPYTDLKAAMNKLAKEARALDSFLQRYALRNPDELP